jgi:hypothetical protein
VALVGLHVVHLQDFQAQEQ